MQAGFIIGQAEETLTGSIQMPHKGARTGIDSADSTGKGVNQMMFFEFFQVSARSPESRTGGCRIDKMESLDLQSREIAVRLNGSLDVFVPIA